MKFMIIALLTLTRPVIAEESDALKKYYYVFFMLSRSAISPGWGPYYGSALRIGGNLLETQSGIFSLGLYTGGFPDQQATSTGFRLSLTGPELLYRRIAHTGFYVSGRVGFANVSSTRTLPPPHTAIGDSFGFSPAAGYELNFPDSGWVMVAEGSWTHMGPATLTDHDGGPFLFSPAYDIFSCYAGFGYTW